MGWTLLGWLLAKMGASLCALPGMEKAGAGALGRALRAAMPWRAASAASRFLADGSGSKLELSWMLCALGFSWGACLAYAAGDMAPALWGSLGGGAPVALLWLGNKRGSAKRAKGKLWLALASSSELCQSMGRGHAGPQESVAEAERRPIGPRHPGFMELARRLAGPFGPGEAAPERSARIRLRAMMLACAGSEAAARWLWRRRANQRSMASWARFLGQTQGASGEGWEIAAALMSLRVPARCCSVRLFVADASDLTESSLPMLWARPPESREGWLDAGDFDQGLRSEAAHAYLGQAPSQWGWRAQEEGSEFKTKIAMALYSSDERWRGIFNGARELLEREMIDSSTGSASCGGGRSRAGRRL